MAGQAGMPCHKRLAAMTSKIIAAAPTPRHRGFWPLVVRQPVQAMSAEECLRPVPTWHVGSRATAHGVQNFVRSVKYRLGLENPLKKRNRKRIVYVGSGWGLMKFLPTINTSLYDLVVVSPRNFFVFTPLLPSVCAGALDPRSCMEPVRRFTTRGGKKLIDYSEGRVEDVDFDKDSLKVRSKNGDVFDLNYDYLVLGVGSEVNTFGIPGVAENAYFLKETENATAIRQQLICNFERASLPGVTDDEKRRLLHFVCVGGGPSGVEVAAEIADFVKDDVALYYPDLVDKISVSVIEMLPRVLPTFNEEVSEFTVKNLERCNVDAYLRTRVTKVTSEAIHVVEPNGKEKVLPCGFVLWASGIGQVPLSKKIMEKVPAQKDNRPAVMRVDEHLFLKGTPKKNVFALGDCSFLAPNPLAAHAKSLYAAAKASPTGAGTSWLLGCKELVYRFPQLHPSKNNLGKDSRDNLSEEEFTKLLKDVDAAYRPPVPTAQNASQQGEWLACVLNDFSPDKDQATMPTFVERNRGALAYVGEGESVAQTPWFTLTGGVHSTLFWKMVYWSMQMSVHNKAMLLVDWFRLMLCGRDISLGRTTDISQKVCWKPSDANEKK